MKRYKLTVRYDGTDYAGLQYQPGFRTVQGEMENALAKALNREVSVLSASRTDSGVHANGQVMSFLADTPIPTNRLAEVINNFLPQDIRVASATEVDEDFHPISDARAKLYTYRFTENRDVDLRHWRYVYRFNEKLDYEAMEAAMAHLRGTHDFAAFRASGGQAATTVRTIYRLEIKRGEEFSTLEVLGNGFLYKMIRIIVAGLLEVGRGSLTPEDILEILEGKERTAIPHTAPPQGLCLERIFYDDDKESWPEEIR